MPGRRRPAWALSQDLRLQGMCPRRHGYVRVRSSHYQGGPCYSGRTPCQILPRGGHSGQMRHFQEDDAQAVLITRESGSFWHYLYRDPHAARMQLRSHTGVLFRLDASEGFLTTECEASVSNEFWLFRPWTAWALAMIRYKTAPVNLKSLCRGAGTLGRDLMIQGFRPGTDGQPVPLSLARAVLLTEEGPWHYFYPFLTIADGQHIMRQWSKTPSILFELPPRVQVGSDFFDSARCQRQPSFCKMLVEGVLAPDQKQDSTSRPRLRSCGGF